MSIADKLTQLTNIRSNIRQKLTDKGVEASDHNFSDFASDIERIETGITPTGSIEITENGTYDVTDKAEAVVDVSGGGKPAKGIIFDEWNSDGFVTKITIVGFDGDEIPKQYLDGYTSTTGATLTGYITDIVFDCSPIAFGESSFRNMFFLTEFNIPNSVKTIGNYALRQLGKITNLVIPSSVETIGWRAFNSCTRLVSVTFKGTPISISTDTFASCNDLRDLYVPWSEGEVANAPWSATKATIHYNYTGE